MLRVHLTGIIAAFLILSCTADKQEAEPAPVVTPEDIKKDTEAVETEAPKMPRLAVPTGLNPQNVKGRVKYIKKPDGGTMPLLLITPSNPAKKPAPQDGKDKSEGSAPDPEDKK